MVGTRARVKFTGFMKGSNLRMPKYEHPVQHRPEKSSDMYSMLWPEYNDTAVQDRMETIVGAVSLFAPYPHEEDKEELNSVEFKERPVTPINDEIKEPAVSFKQVAKYIRRRVAARPEVPHLSVDDQRYLAGVLMGEVNSIWPDIRKQIDDPFLTPDGNVELNRRLVVYIVTVCEQLFRYYLSQAQLLNKRGIFSGPANMSRLVAQLTLDANRLLNILTVRRYIVSDIRDGVVMDKDKLSQSLLSETQPVTYKSVIERIRPVSAASPVPKQVSNEELQQLIDDIPSLDRSKIISLLNGLPVRVLHDQSRASSSEGHSQVFDRMSQQSTISSEEHSREKVLLKRSVSQPNIGIENLHEELGLESIPEKTDPTYEISILKTGTKEETQLSEAQKTVDSRQVVADDLKKLVARGQDGEQDDFEDDGHNSEEDLPPLLQAITRSRKHDGLKEKLAKQMKELEDAEREEKEKERCRARSAKPQHPQPASITAKMPNKMVMKTSDIRVSERVCISSITLQRNSTVYNDLVDEIDSNTVKNLDKSLFLEDEIKEVYREIMKTVPTDHLEINQDDMLEPAPEKVDLHKSIASSSLNKPKYERIMNPNLHKSDKPPWGEFNSRSWAKTPMDPPKTFRGEDQFPPLTPNLDKISKAIEKQISNENMPTFAVEKMSRTYATWLQWWRSTANTDDYMKFLNTQDTDYLGLVFHFYDSEDEDEIDGDPILSKCGSASKSSFIARMAEIQKEKEAKLNEMVAEKTSYEEGMWNVNAVMMGGLGKEPSLSEPTLEPFIKPAESLETVKHSNALLSRSQHRRSARSTTLTVQTKETGQSNLTISQATSWTQSGMYTFRSEQNDIAENTKLASAQERLEKVWTLLKMPDAKKLDMAIKYSSDAYFPKLKQAIESWETVTELIIKRENVMSRIEEFERDASDPNRFFEKGARGSSVFRLEEARRRSAYYKRVDELDEDIKDELLEIKGDFDDEVSYKGRPYLDKMKWDRIEMLYWLQEERKENALKFEIFDKHIPIRMNQLEPMLMTSSS